MYRVLILVTEHYGYLIEQLRTRKKKNKSYNRVIIRHCWSHKKLWFQLFLLLRRRRCVCTESPGGHDSSPSMLWMDFISGPHAAAKCASELFSCAQGSVSWSPKPRKLQCSQAENRNWIWTPAFAHRRPPANSHHDWKPERADVGCGFSHTPVSGGLPVQTKLPMCHILCSFFYFEHVYLFFRWLNSQMFLH